MPDFEPGETSLGFFNAQLGPDLQVLDELLADDFLFIEPFSGWKVFKKTLIHDLAVGALAFAVLEAHSIYTRTYENTAVVTGDVETKGRLGEANFAVKYKFTHVYACQQGQWRMVAAQGTPIHSRWEGLAKVAVTEP